ncbi:MAG: hypothetical protein LBQ48_06545 [Oscillospiraceae bacterium]|jgi:hypothetical protein|nr:hypothetical protein [Oscillospiraceae bacterium]
MEHKPPGGGLLSRVLAVFFALFLFSYVAYQLYESTALSVRTETVFPVDFTDSLEVDGTIIREEVYIDLPQTGAVVYNLPDGGWVSAGGVVADVFSDPEAADAKRQVTRLARRRDALLSADIPNQEYSATDLTLLESQIDERFLKVTGGYNSGSFNLDTDSDALLTLLCKRQLLQDKVESFQPQVNDINRQIAELNVKIGAAGSPVKTQKAGFFSGVADGFEHVLKPSDISDLTPERYAEAKTRGTGLVFGKAKVIIDYQWYVALELSATQASAFSEGTGIFLKIEEAFLDEFPATVYRINKASGSDQAVVVFSCSVMNDRLAQIRFPHVKILRTTYSGLRVNSLALRTVENELGVFVVSGLAVKFCPVKVLCTSAGYSVCEPVDGTTNGILRAYDELVVEGKELYDGKVIG